LRWFKRKTQSRQAWPQGERTMEQTSDTLALGIQLVAAAALLVLMTITHSVGLVGISKALRLEKHRLREHAFNVQAIGLLASFGLLLFALHIAEIFIFAVFYLAVGAIGTFEEALYYSASAYATLGWTAEYFPQDWRLIGALEALIGFLLIGWSTAFIVSTMQNLSE
jgi:hypothetical protein